MGPTGCDTGETRVWCHHSDKRSLFYSKAFLVTTSKVDIRGCCCVKRDKYNPLSKPRDTGTFGPPWRAQSCMPPRLSWSCCPVLDQGAGVPSPPREWAALVDMFSLLFPYLLVQTEPCRDGSFVPLESNFVLCHFATEPAPGAGDCCEFRKQNSFGSRRLAGLPSKWGLQGAEGFALNYILYSTVWSLKF